MNFEPGDPNIPRIIKDKKIYYPAGTQPELSEGGLFFWHHIGCMFISFLLALGGVIMLYKANLLEIISPIGVGFFLVVFGYLMFKNRRGHDE